MDHRWNIITSDNAVLLPILIHIFALLKGHPALPFLHPFCLYRHLLLRSNLIIAAETPLLHLPRVHKSFSRTGDRRTNWERKIAGENSEVGATYHISPMSHEDGEVGQVTTGASGVALIGFQQLAALSGPVSHHASLRVIPEGAVRVVIMLFLQNKKHTKDPKSENNWINSICVYMFIALQKYLPALPWSLSWI